jgi:hypothetical protein
MKKSLALFGLVGVLAFCGFGCANSGDMGTPWFPAQPNWSSFDKTRAVGPYPLTNAVLRSDLDCGGFSITNAADVVLDDGTSLLALSTSCVYESEVGLILDLTHTGTVAFLQDTNGFNWDIVQTNVYPGSFDGTNYTVVAALEGSTILITAGFNGNAGVESISPARLYLNHVTNGVTNVVFETLAYNHATDNSSLDSTAVYYVTTVRTGDRLYWAGSSDVDGSIYTKDDLDYWQITALRGGE